MCSCALCTADTLENCAKSADRNVPYCETFNRCVVKLLQFYLQKGGAKNTAVLMKLCIENGISFVKLGKIHEIRCSCGAMSGVRTEHHLPVLTSVTN